MNSVDANLADVRDPIRVGFIIDSLRPGAGTENQLILLLRNFDRRCIAPFACCLNDDGAVSEEHISCPIECVAVNKMLSPNGARGILMVRRWLRERQIELLVTFFRDANIVGTIAAALAGVSVISSRRNIGGGYWHTPVELRALRFLNRLTSSFVANSKAVREYTARAERIPPERIAVIPNAIDLDRFFPSQDEPDPSGREQLKLPAGFLVVCVANLRPIKAVDTLIRAFAESGMPGHGATLILVGSGPDEPSLVSLALDLGISERVRFLGSREDVPEILRTADLAVLPSLGEGSPNAVLEYMAARLPIIATEVGGTPEILRHGEEGILIPPRRVKALAAAMDKLFRSPEKRSALGQAGRRRVERDFSLHKTVDQWVIALRNEVARHRGARR